jgi:hypothetical protein
MEALTHIKWLKIEIFKNSVEQALNTLMPLLHIQIYLLTYYQFQDTNHRLKGYVEELEELRMLPLPYGLLANELVEVIDQERVMPGITWIGKFAEDYPFLDHHSTLKEKGSLPLADPRAPPKEISNPH